MSDESQTALPSDGAVGELEEQFKALAECVEDRNFSNEVLGICLRARWADLTTTLTRLAAGQEADAKRIEALEGALRPFADYAVRDGFGLDNEGAEIPDAEGVGWVYLTVGDFRRAGQALSPTPGKDG